MKGSWCFSLQTWCHSCVASYHPLNKSLICHSLPKWRLMYLFTYFQLLLIINLFPSCSHILHLSNKKSHRVRENTQINCGWFLLSWYAMVGEAAQGCPCLDHSGHTTVFLKPYLHLPVYQGDPSQPLSFPEGQQNRIFLMNLAKHCRLQTGRCLECTVSH